MERRGDWMQTYTGRQYWPLSPHYTDVYIEDIAHALSLACRYGGHCLNFYSVSEHSCHLYDKAEGEDKIWALLHDASEAYIADIIRPVKPYLANYNEIEEENMYAICMRFGIPLEMPASVKLLDDSILWDEMTQNMNTPPEKWHLRGAPLGVTLQFWEPKRAETEFLRRFDEWKLTQPK